MERIIGLPPVTKKSFDIERCFFDAMRSIDKRRAEEFVEMRRSGVLQLIYTNSETVKTRTGVSLIGVYHEDNPRVLIVSSGFRDSVARGETQILYQLEDTIFELFNIWRPVINRII